MIKFVIFDSFSMVRDGERWLASGCMKITKQIRLINQFTLIDGKCYMLLCQKKKNLGRYAHDESSTSVEQETVLVISHSL